MKERLTFAITMLVVVAVGVTVFTVILVTNLPRP